MNSWVNKSFKIVKSEFYLDRLLDIYPPDEIVRGKLTKKDKSIIEMYYKEQKCTELIKGLINLRKKGFKFPLESPYVNFFAHCEEAVNKNPKTVKKICSKIYSLTFNELVKKLEDPKKPSRRIGPMFRDWLRNNFEFKVVDEFANTNNQVIFLDGSDKVLKEYAIRNLRCSFRELSKGLDFIAKISGDIHIVGTAKFITDFGGSQDNQFNEAISMVKETICPSNVLKVAIIDGVAWLGGKMASVLQNLNNDEFCFSALLLDEFIRSNE